MGEPSTPVSKTVRRREGCGRPTEVAEFLDVSKRTVQRWDGKDGFPTSLKFGPNWSVFRWDDIYAWLDERAAASAK